ncbi:MAG: Stp1/IreP family PP2C-type Ser/Thr phosphatase [Desulfobacterales bacterium]
MTPNVTIGAATDVGKRKTVNEDAFAFFPPEKGRNHPKGLLMAVADGLGGRAGGAQASKIAVDTLMKWFYDDPAGDVVGSLQRAFAAAHKAVIKTGDQDLKLQGMATTLTATVLLGDRLYHAHVGDSRAYIADTRGLRSITKDHSYVASLVRAGAITEEQAKTHPQRNLVTQAVGASKTLRIDLPSRPHALEDGSMVLLCCDGLYKDLSDSEILGAIRSTPDPTEACQKLVALANDRGGTDNITAVLARVSGIGGFGSRLRRIFHAR